MKLFTKFGTLLCAVSMIFQLSACGTIPGQSSTQTSSASSKPEASSTLNSSSTISSQSQSSAPQLTVDPSQEPPLPEYAQNIAVPDFLDQEQQNIYRRAYALYGCFNGNSDSIDDFPRLDGTRYDWKNPLTTEIDGQTYYISQGRYQNWADFEGTMLAVFTPEFFESKIDPPDSKWPPLFRSENEKLCFMDVSMGSDPSRSDIANVFELVSKTDEKIGFTVVGHYMNHIEGETDEEYIARRANSFDFTRSYSLALRNENGSWRFSEFNVPA